MQNDTENKYVVESEVEGIGLCPYSPEHNSTAVFHNGQIFSATVADFSGGDPLIYRQPQRTELSDLKQLNGIVFINIINLIILIISYFQLQILLVQYLTVITYFFSIAKRPSNT